MKQGEKYGALTLRYKESNYWVCSCDCGRQNVHAKEYNLRNHFYPCCGACEREGKYILEREKIRKEQAKLRKKINAFGSVAVSQTPFGQHIATKGEREIYAILSLNKEPFKFDEPPESNPSYPNGGSFRFDFQLPKRNIFIEYDGEEHFYPVAKYDGVKGFEKRQLNDKYKNQWCKEHNIVLIRIPYTKLGKITFADLINIENNDFRVV